jgi:septum formation protein
MLLLSPILGLISVTLPICAMNGYPKQMLYLASQSPRRRELLTQMGVEFGVLDVDVPELRLPGEAPDQYVNRVAREKAAAGLLKVMSNPSALVLAADTEVVLNDEVFGKPNDAEDAARMLRMLSAKTHRVISCIWLVNAGNEQHAVCESRVQFKKLSQDDISRYLSTQQWQGKAGGYAIQGRAASFISDLQGSYSGVMGLPIFETSQLLKKFGIDV